MIYPDNFERKIGFSEIRTLLKGRCMSTLGTEWVDKELVFLSDFEKVKEALACADEFARFQQEAEDDLENDFFDVREALVRVRPERTFMEELDLFNLKRSLLTILNYQKAFVKQADEDPDSLCSNVGADASDSEQDNEGDGVDEALETDAVSPHYVYPALGRIASQVAVYPQIVKRIDEVLNKY